MRAVVYAGPGEVRLDEVTRPVPVEADDAIVAVRLTAICGSDLHLLDGKTPGMRTGGVIGHEFVGVVTETGTGVATIQEGDPVLGSFLIACGSCESCAAGRFNFCAARRALGLGTLTGDLDGAQAEYVRVPHADVNLKHLGPHDRLTDEQALFAGDVLATGAYGAHLAAVAPDDVVAIFGAGPVGLLTAMSLGERPGATLVLDTDPRRVEFAATVLDHAVAVGLDGRGADEVVAGTAGRLADVAIEAVGSIPAFKGSLRAVRDGGRVVVVGVYGAERYDLPMGMVWSRGLEVRFAGMANVQGHWDDALAAVGAGRFDPSRLITHRLPLEDAVEGYELFRSRDALKVILSP